MLARRTNGDGFAVGTFQTRDRVPGNWDKERAGFLVSRSPLLLSKNPAHPSVGFGEAEPLSDDITHSPKKKKTEKASFFTRNVLRGIVLFVVNNLTP